MNLAILDMPEDVVQLRAWLERELVGLRLRDVVTELTAFQAAANPGQNLESVCGPELATVCQKGLAALSELQLRALLRQPNLLYELQERVLVDGTNYWRQLERTSDHQDAVKKQRVSIDAALAQQPKLAADTSPAARHGEKRAFGQRPTWLAFATALAATLLIGFFISHNRSTPTWGWARPGALAVDMPAPAYLNHLADVAQEWPKDQPADPKTLAKSIQQFRHSCDVLIAAPHSPLAAADREWLIERCKAWSGKFDEQLADLKSATKTPAQVQLEANATVDKLIQALRDRAKIAA